MTKLKLGANKSHVLFKKFKAGGQWRDSTIASAWQRGKCPTVNYSAISVNTFLPKLKEESRRIKISKRLTERDTRIMRELREKYGSNCDLMFKDTKINVWQWNKPDLMRKIKKLEADEVMPFPEEGIEAETGNEKSDEQEENGDEGATIMADEHEGSDSNGKILKKRENRRTRKRTKRKEKQKWMVGRG